MQHNLHCDQHSHCISPALTYTSRTSSSTSDLGLHTPAIGSQLVPTTPRHPAAMAVMNQRTKTIWATAAVLASLAMLPMLATAADADPLQDFCVADNATALTINGFPCKPAHLVSGDDFKSPALAKPGLIKNPNFAAVTPASVNEFLALNTLGISAARIDFAKGGLNPPHTHTRATELLLVTQGELYVGFVDTSSNMTLFATTVRLGELFVFPRGLVHFQLNVGKGPAVAFSALNSQNAGVQKVADSLFNSSPDIKDEVLEKAFRIGEETVDQIRKNIRAM